MRRALFLDRDGIINHDTGYPHLRRHIRPIPGAVRLCRAGMARGYALILVTNQAGIGRGLYAEAAFRSLTRWLLRRLARRGIAFRGVEYCPDHPTAGRGRYRHDNPRRKPGPGMILDAAARHGIHLRSSVMIGDHATDAAAGRAAGVGAVVLVSASAEERASVDASVIVLTTVAEAARWLAARSRARPAARMAPGLPPSRGDGRSTRRFGRSETPTSATAIDRPVAGATGKVPR